MKRLFYFKTGEKYNITASNGVRFLFQDEGRDYYFQETENEEWEDFGATDILPEEIPNLEIKLESKSYISKYVKKVKLLQAELNERLAEYEIFSFLDLEKPLDIDVIINERLITYAEERISEYEEIREEIIETTDKKFVELGRILD